MSKADVKNYGWMEGQCMREIKFRGKCKEKWLYGDFIHQDKFNRSMIKQDNYTAVVDVNTLGQYTRIKR